MTRKDYFTKQILVIIKPRKDALSMKPTRKGNVLKKDILFSKHTFPLVGLLTFGLRITLNFIARGFIGWFRHVSLKVIQAHNKGVYPQSDDSM